MDTADLILFAGQSNMAGRGAVCERFPETAPEVTPGAGWEYRAISAPDRLTPLREPFGYLENNPTGIHETLKTGSLASAFVNACHAGTGVPVVGVSAAKGGSIIREWTEGSAYMTDAADRLQRARGWLETHGIAVRHTLTLWCQGESDCDERTGEEDYLRDFGSMVSAMMDAGAERLMMIRIGRCNLPEDPARYDRMIALQDRIAERDPRVVMVCRCFAGMRERGLMKDTFHYWQAGYNEAGREAGENTAAWLNAQK